MFPEIGRYSLGNLARELSIVNENPHRALSDALTAAEVLIHCIHADYDEQRLRDPKLGLLKVIQLPDHLSASTFDTLPKEPGVYQFMDAFGSPLYIGKAKNIKSRITQHFSTDQGASKYQRLMKECYDITYHLFPNETLSLVYEDHLIRQYWPPLNKAQKNQSLKFGLYTYTNGKGEHKWVVQKIIGHGALRKFGSYVSGQQWLSGYLKECELKGWTHEQSVQALQPDQGQRLLLRLWPEQGALFIEKGSITGIYSGDDFLYSIDWVREHFVPVQPSPTINAIGMKMLDEHPNNIILI
jgi:DNA polymerase-3 subunit epsilon